MEQDVRKRVGGRLLALRMQQHLDQIEVARRAGISPGTLQTIEWGARENREANIEKVARVFGTTLEALKERDHLAPNDPLLKDLNREDFQIARAYHEAASAVRDQARRLLRDRDPEKVAAPTSDELAILAAQIARLSEARRQLVFELVAQLERLDTRDDKVS